MSIGTVAELKADHGSLMDSVYRSQRHIYDLTRKYYLFGRDTLIDQLDPSPSAAILEIACGTGRNLDRIARRWPGTSLHGLDISHEMLKSARARLGTGAVLAHGDATAFDPAALFGRGQFDRIVLSYSLSMIPDWHAALDRAATALAPGGSLHIVDFGELEGLPSPLRTALRGWLGRFHVTPRHDLADFAKAVAERHRMASTTRDGAFGYYKLITLIDRRC